MCIASEWSTGGLCTRHCIWGRYSAGCVCLCWGAVCTLHFIVTRSFRSIYDFFLSHLLTIECSKWFIWSETVLESIVGIRFCCRWHMSFVHTVAIQTVVFWLDLRFSCFMMFWILWKQLSMRLLVKYIKGGWIQEGSTVGACPSNLQYSSEGRLFWLCVPCSYFFCLYMIYIDVWHVSIGYILCRCLSGTS